MSLPRLRIDLVTACADGDGLATMALVRRHELDAALAVQIVVLLHKGRHPQASLLGSNSAVSNPYLTGQAGRGLSWRLNLTLGGRATGQ
jgi:hypothetical protein